MIHDPLCPVAASGLNDCQCVLITRVRAEEADLRNAGDEE